MYLDNLMRVWGGNGVENEIQNRSRDGFVTESTIRICKTSSLLINDKSAYS